MIAVYDLEYWQPSFCTLIFLVGAERERLIQARANLPGAGGIDVELWKSNRRHKGWPRTQEETDACIQNIFLPMCEMLPSVSSVRVIAADKRPASYDGAFSLGYKFLTSLAMVPYAEGLRPLFPKVRARHPGLVTITLRECGNNHWHQRDSNVEEWRKAAIELTKTGYDVRVVRDFFKADEPLSGCVTVPEASRNLHVRAALYYAADLNLFVNNGPAWFTLFLDAPTLIFKITCDTAGKSHSAASMEAAGFIRGQQMVGAPPHQRICWEEETAANIVSEAIKQLDPRDRSRNVA